MTSTSLERTVMRRVKTIHALRPLMRHGILATLVLLLSLIGIGREVWVARVLENMPPLFDVSATVSFFASAFLSTEPSVQVLTAIVAISSVLIAHAFGTALKGIYSLRTI